jgi:predicted DNA-binding protein (MmcQ/YjbR family)
VTLFDRDIFESFIAALPATEIVHQWGDASVGKVGGKIFAIHSGGADAPSLSFKCSDMAFELLPDLDGVEPAPYLARARWVALGPGSALDENELPAYLREAHRLVAGKLTRKLRNVLDLDTYLATR